jgi:hypothetical protein
LRDRLYADFRDPGDYADTLQRLLRSIRHRTILGSGRASSIRLQGALPESATSTCVPKRGTALRAVRDPARGTTICAWNAVFFVRSLVVRRR